MIRILISYQHDIPERLKAESIKYALIDAMTIQNECKWSVSLVNEVANYNLRFVKPGPETDVIFDRLTEQRAEFLVKREVLNKGIESIEKEIEELKNHIRQYEERKRGENL